MNITVRYELPKASLPVSYLYYILHQLYYIIGNLDLLIIID
jgi:hypothetical protein